MRFLNVLLAVAVTSLCFLGCAQRVSLHASHGQASKKIFFQQGSTAPVQLAPVTSEDAKRISESRARRSGAKPTSGRSQRFSFGTGANSAGSILE
jgi:hypothetical protein